MILPQLIANGLIAGSLTALVAAGFSVIYSTNRFVPFAHGAVASLGGYLFYTLFDLWRLPALVSALLSIGATGLFGWGLYLVFYRHLRRRRSSGAVLLIASIGLMLLIQNALLLVFGAGVKSIGLFAATVGLNIGGANVTPLQLIMLGAALLLLALLWLFVRRSKLGTKLRAVADNPELAATTGINVRRVEGGSWFIGSVLAAVAGILIGLEQNLTPHMGTSLVIRGFTGAVIGGAASLPGAILGSYLLGLVENIGIWWLPSSYKEAIAFSLLILFLLFRPAGILGIRKGVR